jgi:hypothetical protein
MSEWFGCCPHLDNQNIMVGGGFVIKVKKVFLSSKILYFYPNFARVPSLRLNTNMPIQSVD